MKEIEMSMSLYEKDGQQRVLFRKSFSRERDREFIESIVKDIISKGKAEVKAVIRFKDPVKAIVVLREAGFLDTK